MPVWLAWIVIGIPLGFGIILFFNVKAAVDVKKLFKEMEVEKKLRRLDELEERERWRNDDETDSAFDNPVAPRASDDLPVGDLYKSLLDPRDEDEILRETEDEKLDNEILSDIEEVKQILRKLREKKLHRESLRKLPESDKS